MRKMAILLAAAGFMAITSTVSYASDWESAGKALTAIEGVRVLTGGRVDLIGNLAVINRGQEMYAYGRQGYDPGSRHYQRRRIWVPNYVLERRYVPARIEYKGRHRVILPGHYVTYRVERGGHWEYAGDYRR
jgi:hypothetical protein